MKLPTFENGDLDTTRVTYAAAEVSNGARIIRVVVDGAIIILHDTTPVRNLLRTGLPINEPPEPYLMTDEEVAESKRHDSTKKPK